MKETLKDTAKGMVESFEKAGGKTTLSKKDLKYIGIKKKIKKPKKNENYQNFNVKVSPELLNKFKKSSDIGMHNIQNAVQIALKLYIEMINSKKSKKIYQF